MKHVTRQITRRLVGIALAGAAAGITFHSAAAQQAVRTQGESQVAAMDFVVVGRDGTPVTDLKAAEVTLRIDGRPRPIKSLEFVRYSNVGLGGSGSPPAPPFATNTVVETPRAILLVVDDESMPIGQEQRLREALIAFIDHIPASDRVAIVTVPHGGIKVDLTSDRDRLRRGIAEISPMTPVQDPACQARTMLGTLRSTFQTLAKVATQPVVVAFFSSRLGGSTGLERSATPSALSGAGGLSIAGGACRITNEDFEQVGDAAAEARAQVYVVHPDYNPTPATDGIQNLRGVTGAPLLHLTGAGNEPGLNRLARETVGYYVATFDTEPGERTGAVHQSNVRVERRDVEVRYRPNVLVGRTAATTVAEPVAGYSTAFEVVRSGRPFRDVGLRAASTPTRGEDNAINVVTIFEPVDPSAKIASAAAALFDATGKAVAYWTGEAKDLTTFPAAIGMTAPKGRYRLRVGVIDQAGRYGVVDDVVNAELMPAGPLQLGGISFGVSRGSGFQHRLQITTEPSILAMAEFYGGGPAGTPIRAVFEVAETTDGPALFRVPGAISGTAEEGRFSIAGTITVGILPPGDYVIRAIVEVKDQPGGRVVRTVRKAG
jgi:VWFA-related protein